MKKHRKPNDVQDRDDSGRVNSKNLIVLLFFVLTICAC